MFRNKTRALLTLGIAWLLAFSVGAEEAHRHAHQHAHGDGDTQRQHGAHVHGMASLTVAQDGRQVLLELESPAANIFGFEHAPGNEQQRTVVREALHTLRNPESLFAFPDGAGCVFQEADIDTPFTADSHSEHAHAEAHAAHSDILAGYRFECAHPERLEQLRLGLFSAFPRFEELRVQFILGGHQGAATLDATKPVLAF